MNLPNRPTTDTAYLERWASHRLPEPGETPEPVMLARKAMDHPLGDFGGWVWFIRCSAGCEDKKLWVDPHILSLPPDITVRQVAGRMRCRCGARPSLVALWARNVVSGRDPYLPVILDGFPEA